jgi:TonB-linked SusC/RagA family outer membrane protein
MKKFLLVFLILGFTLPVFSQGQKISGKVTSAEDGSPIPGASVTIKGTNNGTQTLATGDYTLTAPKGATLVFSFIGFKNEEIKVGDGSTINVSLATSVDILNEVVVTALGAVRDKKALNYAVQELKGENLTVAKSLDVSSSLAGKIAGVQLVGSPSSTFDNANVLIRGVTGLGLAYPIFVVDGTITDQSAVIMDNMESITVLKGPAATALYGQRAANGAVILTTKKGKRGKNSSVDLNLGVSFEKLALLPPYQNEYAGGYASSSSTKGSTMDDMGYLIFKYNPAIHPASWASFNGQRMLDYGADESWGPKIDGSTLYRPYFSWYPGDEFGVQVPMTAQPDNVKNFFNTGHNYNNTVAFSSGDYNYNYRLTYGNQDRTLTIPGARRQQHQFALNGSYDINKLITVSSDITYTTRNTTGQPIEGYRLDGLNVTQNFNQWFQRQLDIEKMKTYRQPDGSLNSWNIGNPNASSDLAVYGQPQYWDNPYFVIKENYGTQMHNRLVGNIGLTLNLAKGLELKSYARMSNYTNENDQRVASGGLNLDSYSILQNFYRELNLESNLIYKRKFGDNISFDGLLGVNKRKNYYSQLSQATAGGLSTANYFDLAASIARPTVTRDYEKKIVNSIYGKASVGYKDFLFLEGTLRNDWSSALPVNANSYLYPSLGANVIFTELLPKNNILTFGKLRASYASVGSDLNPHSLDLALNNGAFYGTNSSVAIGDQFRGGTIRPALTKAWEAGTELKFYKLITLDVAVYKNNNTDQILSVDVSPSSGFTSTQINAGNIESKGIELTLTTNAINRKNFNWDISLNWARNKNLVKSLHPDLKTYLYATNRYDTRLEHREGEEWGLYVGRKWRTNEKGQVIVDATGLPLYDINVPIGNVLPKWTGGMFNSMSYKSFNLTFSIDFQKGGLFYSETRNFNTGAGLSEETVGINDKGFDWRDFPGTYTKEGGNTGNGGIRIDGVFADGTPNNRYITARAYWYTARQRDASNVLLDASYVKLREVRFGYDIPAKLVQKTRFAKSANFGVIVQNAFLIWANTKKYGVDPSELEVFYREGGQLSASRSTGFNLKLMF